MVDQNRISWPGWETGNLIGRGSFGEVYEIHRNVFGTLEQAALKVITIPQHGSDVEEMYNDGYDAESITSTFRSHLESIVAEYTLMRKLSGCTNIVNCDDIRYVQHDDGIGWDIFIKMELLTPLNKALSGQIEEETVIKIGRDMCTALELCKHYGIVHRDIKPQNIFVSATGDYKLGDFGIAKTVERTMGGTKIGTYKYMAPEVYNNQPYGTGADIYSLGLVLYWMLNEKRMPFLPLPPAKLNVSMEDQARNRRLSGEQLPPPAHGSAKLKAIVLRACAYDPKLRYASATEMLNALQALTKPQPEPIPEPAPAPGPNPVENLDVRQTLKFSHDDNPAGKVIAVPVGNDTMRVLIPQQFENGQTLYYEGMGLKSAYSEARGNLYLTVSIAPQTAPVPPVVPPEKENTSKIWPILAAVVVLMLIIMGIWKSAFPNTNNQQNNSHQHIWIAANCTKPNTCNSCGATSGTALGHNWKEATYHSPKTCTRCGQTEGEPLVTEGTMQDAPLTATVTSTATPNRTKITCTAIDASSYLKFNTTGHPPINILDGRADTSWQEGVNGWGINEWIRISFDRTHDIKYLSFQMGFWKTDNAYWENGRPAKIRLDFSDGSSVVCTIPDQIKTYEVTLSKAVQANWVKITILSVYEGTAFEDTCISEISVYS